MLNFLAALKLYHMQQRSGEIMSDNSKLKFASFILFLNAYIDMAPINGSTSQAGFNGANVETEIRENSPIFGLEKAERCVIYWLPPSPSFLYGSF